VSEHPVTRSELRERREALAEQVAQRQFDLGGLAYEMAIRDHFRLDVLVRRAAALQELDAQLGEVERLLALGESATTGSCPACGALHGRGAVFCWQCGNALVRRTTANGTEPDTAPAPGNGGQG
jgi:predicted RNA-binding Zn-ribbon protein involved in translation (DUF1610 family)